MLCVAFISKSPWDSSYATSMLSILCFTIKINLSSFSMIGGHHGSHHGHCSHHEGSHHGGELCTNKIKKFDKQMSGLQGIPSFWNNDSMCSQYPIHGSYYCNIFLKYTHS